MNFSPESIRINLTKFTAELPVIFLLFALALALTPSFDIIIWAIPYDEKRIFELAILCVAAGGILFSKQISVSWLESFQFLPALTQGGLCIILVLGIASSTLAASPRDAFLELCLFGLLFSFAISISTLVKRNPPIILGAFFGALLSSIFFYEITFFSAYIGSFIQLFPFDADMLFANFSNVRFLNQFQVWTLPLMLLPLLLYRDKLNLRTVAFIFFLGIAWWVIVFATRGRGIQLAILAASVLTLLVFHRHAWPLIKLLWISALLGGIAYLFLFVYLPPHGEGEAVKITGLLTDNGRTSLWTTALKMALDNPLLGVGPGHYAWYPNDIAAHPHNALLQIMSEWGIPVAILFLLLFCWGGIAWCRQFYRLETIVQDNRKKHLWIGLFCSATAGIAYSMVSGVIVMPLGQIMFAAVIGIMLGLYRFAEPVKKTYTPLALGLLRLALAGFTAYLLIAVTPDILTRIETPSPPYNDAPVITKGPRFWQEGGIPH